MEPVQPEVKKGFNPLYLVGGLALLGLIGFFVISGNKKPATVSEAPQPLSSEATSVVSEASPSGSVKEFTVDGSNYEFDPPTITVSKGDTVKITFKDVDGMHNLVIGGYNVSTKTVAPGKEDSVTFIADKVGSFEYFCSVANHRDLGMTGTLVVQ